MSKEHHHPVLSINLNYTSSKDSSKDKAFIYGGSCLAPTSEALSTANYFIALDEQGLANRLPNVPLHLFYPIEDGKSPAHPEEFHKMIDDLCLLLQRNLILHIGCVGSHGRTGLVMAAIVQKMSKPLLDRINISAIDYVRNLYCVEAVETEEQEQFLIKHCGVKKPQILEI